MSMPASQVRKRLIFLAAGRVRLVPDLSCVDVEVQVVV